MTTPLALLVVILTAQAPKDGYPHHRIADGALSLDVALPDAALGYHRGTRFDWSGMIREVRFEGHSFVAPWKDSHDPANHDDCTGPAEEFGMDDPLGFAEAKPGEPFVKIGVGVLERPDGSAYGFWKRYKIVEPGRWDVEAKGRSIAFRQAIDGPRGWGYSYEKTVSITDDATFTIAHTLKNTGSRPIATTHYAHNFLKIDGEPIGPSYWLTFPYEVEPLAPAPGLAEVRGKAMTFREVIPPGRDVAVKLSGPRPAGENVVTVRNRKTGAAVRIAGDAPLAKLNVWSVGTATCPEPFVAIDLAPGRSTTWTNTYTFSLARPEE